MGTFSFAGGNISQGTYATATAEMSLGGGIVFAVAILLIVIAGFLILNYRKDELKIDERYEDRDIGINKGIAKNKIDN